MTHLAQRPTKGTFGREHEPATTGVDVVDPHRPTMQRGFRPLTSKTRVRGRGAQANTLGTSLSAPAPPGEEGGIPPADEKTALRGTGSAGKPPGDIPRPPRPAGTIPQPADSALSLSPGHRTHAPPHTPRLPTLTHLPTDSPDKWVTQS